METFPMNASAVALGVELTFENICYTVKDRQTGRRHDILKGISGRISPNRLTVIMGSSGAGKTTLLDILACNIFGDGTISGNVLVNGKQRNPAAFAQLSSYVLQRDVLLASSTVREAIMLSALLKLPRDMPHADKVARVDAILKELDLERCQDTLIGDELQLKKGISGGQRRRVSVGIELVKSPRVLFLDEPTSGLDSEMAASLVDTLASLARQNCTIVTTLHQPNSLIASKFDDFFLLHAGACAYAGPYAGSVDYFAARGCQCPQYVNPTDYFMGMLREKGDELVAQWSALEKAYKLNGGDIEGGGAGAKGEMTVVASLAPGAPQALEITPAANAAADLQALELAPSVSWPYQVYLLSGRMFRQYVRNPEMLVSEVVQYIFMAIFCGLVWLQLGDSLVSGPRDRAASIWFAMAILSLVPSFTAVTVWDKDRMLLHRENQRGMYDVTAWFNARTLITLPMQIIQTALFSLIMFWMVGYAPTASNFFVFTAALILFQIISETIGEICAFVCRSSTYGVIVLSLVLLVLMPFSGFLVTNIPVYFRWIKSISYLTYAYCAVLQSELKAVTFETSNGLQVPGSWLWEPSSAPPEAMPIIELSSMASMNNGMSVGGNLGVLAGLAVATRSLAFALIYGLARLKWL